MVRVIARRVPPSAGGNPASRSSARCSWWVASDWPIHDISEEYLYSVHMMQHMALSYFLPPLALMATPPWLARVLLGDGALYKTVRWFTHPVVAGVLFNAMVMTVHVPLLVNASVQNGPLHYTMHVAVVTTSLLMWMPVCGPVPEFRIGVVGSMIYLFLQSVVPTIPAAWLTFADGVVYSAYEKPLRLWGISVVEDQQLAGAAMKTGGSLYLWSIVIFLFFKRFADRTNVPTGVSTCPMPNHRPRRHRCRRSSVVHVLPHLVAPAVTVLQCARPGVAISSVIDVRLIRNDFTKSGSASPSPRRQRCRARPGANSTCDCVRSPLT
jgi:putative membrane protein